MTHYTAITIGPITNTLMKARKTRELWAASFVISLLAKELVKVIVNELDIPKTDFVLPSITNDKVWNEKGVGLFPDRIIFKGSKGYKTDVENLIENAVGKISDAVEEVTTERATDFMMQYFNVHVIDMAEDERLAVDSKSKLKYPNSHINSILLLSPYLNTVELNSKIPLPHSKDLLALFFEQVNKRLDKGKDAPREQPSSFLRDNYGIQDVNGHIRIPSISEIATVGLRDLYLKEYKDFVRKSFNDDDYEFIDELRQHDKKQSAVDQQFKPYHKYICIVQADGDKISKTLGGLKEEELPDFSKSMMDFGIAANKIIKDYNGIPVYIGGDDLLFFAPVNNGKESILNLVEKIDAAFKEKFGSKYPNTSLSYGISITYYKYPMGEALKTALNLMKDDAKDRNGGNAIALQLLKHSGAGFKAIIKKGTAQEDAFKSIMSKYMDNDNSFNTSVIHHIRSNEKVYKHLSTKPTVEEFKAGVENYMGFNLKKNKSKEDNPQNEFVDQVAALVPIAYAQQATKKHLSTEEQIQEANQEVYSLLRLAKFLNGLEDDK